MLVGDVAHPLEAGVRLVDPPAAGDHAEQLQGTAGDDGQAVRFGPERHHGSYGLAGHGDGLQRLDRLVASGLLAGEDSRRVRGELVEVEVVARAGGEASPRHQDRYRLAGLRGRELRDAPQPLAREERAQHPRV